MPGSALLITVQSLGFLVAQTTSPSRPFWQDLLLQALGPLVAALVGSFAVGIILNSWTARKADRTAVRDLRMSLIEESLVSANELRVASDLVYRSRMMGHSTDELRPLLHNARETYARCTIKMPIIETKLELYFPSSRASNLWHSVIDCLAIAYYMSIEAPPELMEYYYEKFAKDAEHEHSGLDGQQIRDRSTVLRRARLSLLETTKLISMSTISPPIGNKLTRN
jgi:hypothetical protein